MRFVLVLWLIHGMVPALGEVAETVVHYAFEGHLAHSDADEGDLGDQGSEHGCGTTEHHCGCCNSQVVATAPGVMVVGPMKIAPGPLATGEQLASLDAPAPPNRPPIA